MVKTPGTERQLSIMRIGSVVLHRLLLLLRVIMRPQLLMHRIMLGHGMNQRLIYLVLLEFTIVKIAGLAGMVVRRRSVSFLMPMVLSLVIVLPMLILGMRVAQLLPIQTQTTMVQRVTGLVMSGLIAVVNLVLTLNLQWLHLPHRLGML